MLRFFLILNLGLLGIANAAQRFNSADKYYIVKPVKAYFAELSKFAGNGKRIWKANKLVGTREDGSLEMWASYLYLGTEACSGGIVSQCTISIFNKSNGKNIFSGNYKRLYLSKSIWIFESDPGRIMDQGAYISKIAWIDTGKLSNFAFSKRIEIQPRKGCGDSVVAPNSSKRVSVYSSVLFYLMEDSCGKFTVKFNLKY